MGTRNNKNGKKQKNDDKKEDAMKVGDYNLGEDIGTKIGEGHDPVEDELR